MFEDGDKPNTSLWIRSFTIQWTHDRSLDTKRNSRGFGLNYLCRTIFVQQIVRLVLVYLVELKKLLSTFWVDQGNFKNAFKS